MKEGMGGGGGGPADIFDLFGMGGGRRGSARERRSEDVVHKCVGWQLLCWDFRLFGLRRPCSGRAS